MIIPEFFRLGFERAVQFSERRNETVPELFRAADMNGGGDHVVARLAHVDVVVGMHNRVRADRFALQLRATVCDHFVRVRVRARAGAGLKNIQRKMLVELSIDNFFGRLHDERAAFGVEQAEIVIGLRGSPLDQPKRPNKWTRKSVAADREN